MVAASPRAGAPSCWPPARRAGGALYKAADVGLSVGEFHGAAVESACMFARRRRITNGGANPPRPTTCCRMARTGKRLPVRHASTNARSPPRQALSVAGSRRGRRPLRQPGPRRRDARSWKPTPIKHRRRVAAILGEFGFERPRQRLSSPPTPESSITDNEERQTMTPMRRIIRRITRTRPIRPDATPHGGSDSQKSEER